MIKIVFILLFAFISSVGYCPVDFDTSINLPNVRKDACSLKEVVNEGDCCCFVVADGLYKDAIFNHYEFCFEVPELNSSDAESINKYIKSNISIINRLSFSEHNCTCPKTDAISSFLKIGFISFIYLLL